MSARPPRQTAWHMRAGPLPPTPGRSASSPACPIPVGVVVLSLVGCDSAVHTARGLGAARCRAGMGSGGWGKHGPRSTPGDTHLTAAGGCRNSRVAAPGDLAGCPAGPPRRRVFGGMLDSPSPSLPDSSRALLRRCGAASAVSCGRPLPFRPAVPAPSCTAGGGRGHKGTTLSGSRPAPPPRAQNTRRAAATANQVDYSGTVRGGGSARAGLAVRGLSPRQGACTRRCQLRSRPDMRPRANAAKTGHKSGASAGSRRGAGAGRGPPSGPGNRVVRPHAITAATRVGRTFRFLIRQCSQVLFHRQYTLT